MTNAPKVGRIGDEVDHVDAVAAPAAAPGALAGAPVRGFPTLFGVSLDVFDVCRCGHTRGVHDVTLARALTVCGVSSCSCVGFVDAGTPSPAPSGR